MKGERSVITRVNPDTLHTSPAFSQVITVSSGARLVFVGGQNATDANGQIVGNDIATQSAQAFRNVLAALEAAGATMDDVIRLAIYVVQGHSIQEGFEAVMQIPEARLGPPTVTAFYVAGLARPDALVEIEALAAVPE